jgi:hypothetical protein
MMYCSKNIQQIILKKKHIIQFYATEDAVQIGNWFIYNLNHLFNSYTFVRASLLPVARSVSQQRARWGLCYVTHGNAKVTWYSPTPGACDVITACCVGTVFQCCCVTSSRLRGYLVYRLVPRTQQWVDMSQYLSISQTYFYNNNLHLGLPIWDGSIISVIMPTTERSQFISQ